MQLAGNQERQARNHARTALEAGQHPSHFERERNDGNREQRSAPTRATIKTNARVAAKPASTAWAHANVTTEIASDSAPSMGPARNLAGVAMNEMPMTSPTHNSGNAVAKNSNTLRGRGDMMLNSAGEIVCNLRVQQYVEPEHDYRCECDDAGC